MCTSREHSRYTYKFLSRNLLKQYLGVHREGSLVDAESRSEVAEAGATLGGDAAPLGAAAARQKAVHSTRRGQQFASPAVGQLAPRRGLLWRALLAKGAACTTRRLGGRSWACWAPIVAAFEVVVHVNMCMLYGVPYELDLAHFDCVRLHRSARWMLACARRMPCSCLIPVPSASRRERSRYVHVHGRCACTTPVLRVATPRDGTV